MLIQAMNRGAVVHEAGDFGEALERAQSNHIDLVLLDLRMPGVNGLAALDALRARLPGLTLVVISGESDPALVREAVERGAMGFIPKSLTPERLVEAIDQVLDRKIYLPEDVLLLPADPAGDRLPELTVRQMEVLRRVVQGRSNKRVARDLGVSSETVKSHLAAAMRALHATNRTELVYIAARRGLRLA